jgi:hypothetical protein
MSRTVVNFLIDLTLLVSFLLVAWTSVVLRFVFPPAASARGWTLWGLTFDDWLAIQFATLCAFTLMVLLHVMLHWSWVCGVIATRLKRGTRTSAPGADKPARLDDGTRSLYGVGTLVVIVNLVGLLIAAAMLSVQPPE